MLRLDMLQTPPIGQMAKRQKTNQSGGYVERASAVEEPARYDFGRGYAGNNISGSAHVHMGDFIQYNNPSLLDQAQRCHRAFKTSPYEDYKNINPKRAQGTCRWALEHPRFLAWQNSCHNDLLWISADPGCGKSVLSRSLVDRDLAALDNTTICYFFFKDNEHQDRLATALCAMLHQLFSKQPDLRRHSIDLWQENGDKIIQEVGRMWKILLDATSDKIARPVICVFDALDECCDDDRQVLIQRLSDFYQRSSRVPSAPTLKFLVTSRPYDNVQRWFEQTALPHIRLRGEDENDRIHDEINLVIDQRVDGLAAELRLPQHDQEKLRQSLRQMKHRTYLWLHLAIEEIRETYSSSLYSDDIAINSVPKSVEDAYERILSKITQKQKATARRILLVIVGARRPLTLNEMALALGAARAHQLNKHSIESLDQERLREQIRQCCGLFVFINHSTLHLIHQTAKEFLLTESSAADPRLGKWKSTMDIKEVEFQMASLSVTFLWIRLREREHNGGAESYIDETFFSYCAEHWASHLTDDILKEDDRLLERAISLYNADHERLYSWFSIMWRAIYPFTAMPKLLNQHVVAISGHTLVLSELYNTQMSSLEARDNTGRTALWWAAERGHSEAVEWFIRVGADINTQGEGDLGSALKAASFGGREKVVQILLDQGADIDDQGQTKYGNALQAASFGGHEKVV